MQVGKPGQYGAQPFEPIRFFCHFHRLPVGLDVRVSYFLEQLQRRFVAIGEGVVVKFISHDSTRLLCQVGDVARFRDDLLPKGRVRLV